MAQAMEMYPEKTSEAAGGMGYFSPPESTPSGPFQFERDEFYSSVGPRRILLREVSGHALNSPLAVIVEHDEDEYFVTSGQVPRIYGCGNTLQEALSMFGDEAWSLWEDLNEDNNWTQEMLDLRKNLRGLFPHEG
ncbi:type II toxin-antitoxin system HicB family antitoxin [Desulfohalovibrio reitneri]|uniref:type II toxin-antitoxin system HicB family antitoxin n=1 Tax=Desulfohalovibrio reitneri TaxID=1307759 RepID=UPI0004A6E5AE|nr:type II toxin-antitoxin system HicB family antitoxin [Desulfohalovibrio reitneri]